MKKIPTIRVIGVIDHDSLLGFLKKMSILGNKRCKEVTVIISSYGGDSMVALAFHDYIRRSYIRVHTVAVGEVSSAAVLILAAGNKRSMTRNSWCMVHDETPNPNQVKNQRLSNLEKVSANFRRFENQWNKLLEERTGTLAETWDKLHRNETYLSAEECKALNLIQEIL